MNRIRILFATTLAFLCMAAWADAPTPVVTGDNLRWPLVTASTINVHRADGSYVESIPGSATSWTAPAPGEYFLVAADERHWSDWPRSQRVTVEGASVTDVPMPVQDGSSLRWPLVDAVSINVHSGDGSYLFSLPGTATAWSTNRLGEFFLVATNDGHWRTWLRSETVTITDTTVTLTGLRADVYSRTAAEIFWNRNAGVGNRYRVFADGGEVANTDGTSWFSNGFTVGHTTVMSVLVIDSNGNQSAPQSVNVTTPGDRPASNLPTINRDNYEEILTDVFGAYFGTQYRELLLTLTDNLLSNVISAAVPFDAPYVCINGGQATFNGPFHIEFDNCQIENAVYSGNFFIGDRNTSISSGGLTISTDTNTEIHFNGFINGPTDSGLYEPSNVSVSVNTPVGDFRMENANHSYSFSHLLRCCGSSQFFLSDYSGSLNVLSPSTGNQLLSAETLTPFSYSQLFPEPADWNHRAGILSVSATDGSRLILNTNTGNDDTVSIQLINGTQIEEFNQSWVPQWSVWQHVLPR